MRALLSLRLSRVLVEGWSMAPALLPGDRVLLFHGVYRFVRPRPGDVALVRTPAVPDREMIKRLAGVVQRDDQRGYIVLGDNAAASTDSRHFGPVPRAQLVGRVLLRYWPDARRGRIPPP